MSLPQDYESRVYAGVLGKIIGVYLGRPFEGWSFEKILDELGEINYYVHEKVNKPLIVTDDDISGTFTFLRALPDYGNPRDLTPQQIGQTWLNYLIEERTVLWWGGMGNSTEHTAYLRMKNGIMPPRSGSIAMNSKVVAEQIGAQIFIDGWAMVAPGDPKFAADLARRAGSVSHDGEALYGAQVIAAMEAQAFVESDLDKLLDVGLSVIPVDCIIARLINELRDLRKHEPDWRKAFAWLRKFYGYDTYGGNCHMIPNHGLIILSLLWGDDDFQKTMMIVNTCGWDTDCNSGNAGCLMGIKNGLAGLETGPDYRGPVADRLYLPTADGGRAVTDALIETYHIVNCGRTLADLPAVTPKNGARFHFDMPGAIQGFIPDTRYESQGTTRVRNCKGHSTRGTYSLGIDYTGIALDRPARAKSATFIPQEAINMPGYGLISSPTLYSGQAVTARLEACPKSTASVGVSLYFRAYGADDTLAQINGPLQQLAPGGEAMFEWTVPDTHGDPVAEIGIEITSDSRAQGTVFVDYLTWEGTPSARLIHPGHNGKMWQKAWVNAVTGFGAEPGDAGLIRVIQNQDTGLLIQGSREWHNYMVSATINPHMVTSTGIGGRVQGLKRYYALLLCADQSVKLVRALDGTTVLAQAPMDVNLDQGYELSLSFKDNQLTGFVDGKQVLSASDDALTEGAIAILCDTGRMTFSNVEIKPA